MNRLGINSGLINVSEERVLTLSSDSKRAIGGGMKLRAPSVSLTSHCCHNSSPSWNFRGTIPCMDPTVPFETDSWTLF
ncbi:ORF253 [White spot syndrome virus]|uniref:ORF253 n=1 Tax=White spot syndrome virus TaxID=342409 RepID=A0A2D3I651_9VIRU|nr:ORF253 [White spot syndrome virus]